jgi:hypothetical protein
VMDLRLEDDGIIVFLFLDCFSVSHSLSPEKPKIVGANQHYVADSDFPMLLQGRRSHNHQYNFPSKRVEKELCASEHKRKLHRGQKGGRILKSIERAGVIGSMLIWTFFDSDKPSMLLDYPEITDTRTILDDALRIVATLLHREHRCKCLKRENKAHDEKALRIENVLIP